jgi:selenophosphate synthase
VPQDKLMGYLRLIGDGKIGIDTPDCSAVKVPNSDKILVSTCDFFYPLVDDPYN